jgi:hypothetical protein
MIILLWEINTVFLEMEKKFGEYLLDSNSYFLKISKLFYSIFMLQTKRKFYKFSTYIKFLTNSTNLSNSSTNHLYDTYFN